MRIGSAIAMLLGVQLSLAGQAAAQDDFVWQYDRYLDADPARLVLFFGLPETDAIQFSAQCRIGAGGAYTTIELGADVGDLEDGTAIEVQFVGDGFSQIVQGAVVGRDREVGITGASISLELDDPLWQAIRAQAELRYNVVGLTTLRLPLKRSSDPTDEFLEDCGEMLAPGEAVAAPRQPTEAEVAQDDTSASCSTWNSLRSAKSGEPTDVTFVNETDGFRAVMWIDFSGMPQHYKDLDPGESYAQQTFVGHPWMITDGPGNCLEVYMPPSGGSVFAITAPAGEFEDE